MANMSKQLTKKQIVVINDLFDSGLSENEVLKKHNVYTRIYRRWLKNELFTDEIEFRKDSARRESELIIARFGPVAAAKLVELTGSEKEETARKACLDIMALPVKKDTGKNPAQENEPTAEKDIPPEKASRILAILAENSD